MRFNALKEDLLGAVQIVQYSSNTKGMMPILSGIKIEGYKDGLVLHATDLESYTTVGCSANVEEEGSCVVSLKIFMDYLRDSGDEKIAVQVVGNEMVLEGSSTTFKLYTMPTEDFPNVPQVEIYSIEGIEGPTFLSSVQKVARAASRDEKRPTLMGMLLEIKEEELTMVSTDSYRLAINNMRGGHAVKETEQYIVPSQAMVNLARIAAKVDKINLFHDENKGQIRFEAGGTNYTIRLIEGKFPKYGQFIPENMENVVEVKRADLIGALKRASLINSTVRLNIKEDGITLVSESREVGEGKEKVEATYGGEEISIAFNSRFLEDGLASLDGETALMGITEPLKPGILKDKENDDFMYIIMPIRL